MGVLDLGPLAKKRVGFIEEKHGLALIRLPEDRAEIFLGFPDVFADHGGKVDLEKFEREFAGQDLCGHGLAGSRRTGKQDIQTFAPRKFFPKSPFSMNAAAQLNPAGDAPKLPHFLRGQRNVIPSVARFDLHHELSDLRRGQRACGIEQVSIGGMRSSGIADRGQTRGQIDCLADPAGSELKAIGQLCGLCFRRVLAQSGIPGSMARIEIRHVDFDSPQGHFAGNLEECIGRAQQQKRLLEIAETTPK